MPLSGYWLDAHSGLVPEPLMDIAAEVIPRLPNLGALMFEILPEHVPGVGLDGVRDQLDALRALWELRPPRTLRNYSSSKLRPTREADANDLDEVRAWETALVDAVRGTDPIKPPFRALLDGDPGLAVFRQLVSEFRAGALVRTLRYTMTALLAGLGRRETHELLDTYFASQQPDAYAAVEAHHFARFLLERQQVVDRVQYLSELLHFEHGLVKATIFGVSSDVQWSADPTSILEALDHGHLPAELPATKSVMRISAASSLEA
jgi:hypothetical protein